MITNSWSTVLLVKVVTRKNKIKYINENIKKSIKKKINYAILNRIKSVGISIEH